MSKFQDFVYFWLLYSSAYAYEQFVVCFWWVPWQMLLNSTPVWSCTSVRVAQTKLNCKKSIKETACFPFKQWFFHWKEVLARRTFNCAANWSFIAVEKMFLLKTTCALERSVKRNFRRPKTKVLAGSYLDFCRKLVLKKWCFFDWCMESWIWPISKCIFEYWFSSSRASSVSTVSGRCRFSGWLGARPHDCPISKRWQCHWTLATSPVWDTPVDCTHDVAMYSMPASPHDRDVMHKARGVM